VEEGATADGPPRRRASWSLKTIVEDVAGRPIQELQDPGRPVHPYLRGKLEAEPPIPELDGAEPYDPVAHLYPPLVGPAAREYHGPRHEHHAETLDRHPPAAPGIGERARTPGPSHQPERLYLHYLLLHMDRLSDSALRYLRVAVEEEIAHRHAPPSSPSPTAAPAPSPAARPPAEPVPPAEAAPPA
jgi:hypothetical protein